MALAPEESRRVAATRLWREPFGLILSSTEGLMILGGFKGTMGIVLVPAYGYRYVFQQMRDDGCLGTASLLILENHHLFAPSTHPPPF